MSAITASTSSESATARTCCPRASDEQLNGVVGRQRRHGPDGLAADSQPLTARREQPQAWAATQQVLGDLGGRRDHVLAVVEHDQQLTIPDHLGQPARVRQIEGGRDRGGHAGRIADGRQLDEARPV